MLIVRLSASLTHLNRDVLNAETITKEGPKLWSFKRSVHMLKNSTVKFNRLILLIFYQVPRHKLCPFLLPFLVQWRHKGQQFDIFKRFYYQPISHPTIQRNVTFDLPFTISVWFANLGNFDAVSEYWRCDGCDHSKILKNLPKKYSFLKNYLFMNFNRFSIILWD